MWLFGCMTRNPSLTPRVAISPILFEQFIAQNFEDRNFKSIAFAILRRDQFFTLDAKLRRLATRTTRKQNGRKRMVEEKKSTSRIRSPQKQWFQNQSRGSNPPWEYSICGDLTERQSELLEHFTEVPRGSKGVIYFDSCGGSVYTGLSLGTLIRLRALRVTAIVIGECSSAALIPFAACKQRLVTPHSTLLFHPMRWQSDEDVRLEEATEWARHFKDLETRMDSLLSTMMNVPHDLLQSWTRPGRFITGPELAEAGIASLFDPFNDCDAWKKVRYV